MQIRISEKQIAWIIITIFILSLIPLLYISRYIHPSTDDYIFSIETYNIWNNTHSFIQTLRSAIETTYNMYINWQGSYSGCFLMALQPGIFNVYWITPFVLIGTFTLSTYWLVHLLIKTFSKSSTPQYLIVSTTLILMSLQFVISPLDAFYWYNGAVYYTFYYSMTLLLACFLIKQIQSDGLRKTIYGICVLVLCIFLAGGNFMTGLLILVILSSILLISIINRQKVPSIIYATLFIFCIAFTINIIAPGNMIRANYIEDNIPAILAIRISFTNGYNYLVNYTTPTAITLFIFISPVIYQLARKSKCSFKYPWLCILLTYAIYCSLFTPTCYALGFPGYERNLHIYQYSYYWFVLINLFYILGSIWKGSVKDNPICKDLTQLASHIKSALSHYPLFIYVLTIFIYGITIIQSPAASKRVFKDIASGKAALFDQEMTERLPKYHGKEQNIIFSPLTVMPASICVFDLKEDPNHWTNQSISLYYRKHSVKLDMHLTEKKRQENKSAYQKDVGPGNFYYGKIYQNKK